MSSGSGAISFRPPGDGGAGAAALGAAVLAALLAPVLELPAWGRAAWAAGCLLAVAPALVNRRRARAIRRCRIDPDTGHAALALGEGGWQAAELRGWLVHPWLITLRLHRHGGPGYFLALPRGAVPAATHRRLRAHLYSRAAPQPATRGRRRLAGARRALAAAARAGWARTAPGRGQGSRGYSGGRGSRAAGRRSAP